VDTVTREAWPSPGDRSQKISALVPLVVVFLVTRFALAFLAGEPELYSPSVGPATLDALVGYRGWAHEIVTLGRMPYAEARIEYPPGALPFIVLPGSIAAGQPYLLKFVALMVLVDAVGLAGLIVLARRWGSRRGPWLWLLGLPLLGPVAWTRLDMIPAVATIWVIVAAAASRWGTTGGLLAFGALTKVYPVFLFPAAWLLSPRRRALLLGSLVVLVVIVLPFVPSLDDMVRSVATFHLRRGIQAESLWANGLFVAREFGYPITAVENFGATHVASSASPLLKQLSTLLSLAALIPGVVVASRVVNRGNIRVLVEVMFTTLALLLVTGRVLSPQYVLWLVGLGAAAACAAKTALRAPILLLLAAATLTQVLYPFLIAQLVWGHVSALVVLTARNVVLVVIALWSAVALLRAGAPEGTTTAAPSPESTDSD
jgi:hypothetical protein